MSKFTEFPFDLYTPTYTYKPPTPKVEKKPIKKTIIKPKIQTTQKKPVTPFLQQIMKGKEADTKIKLSKQQGKKPDYEDLLAFHNMSEDIELTYGGSNDRGNSINNNNTLGGSKNDKQTNKVVRPPHRKN